MLKPRQLTLIASLIMTIASLSSCGSESIKGTGGSKQETRETEVFTGIHVKGAYSILGKIGAPDKLVISSNPNVLPHIKSYFDDNILIIKYDNENIKPSVQQDIWFTTKKLNHIELDGDSQFQLNNIKSEKLDCTLSGSHQLALQGQADKLKIISKGNTSINARGLLVKDAEIEINGSGNVAINASDNLKVIINGTGQVTYYDNKPKVEQQIHGSGSVQSAFSDINSAATASETQPAE